MRPSAVSVTGFPVLDLGAVLLVVVVVAAAAAAGASGRQAIAAAWKKLDDMSKTIKLVLDWRTPPVGAPVL